ncbi:coiled-coil domain-containing protein 138 isoform X2 [Notamacropus eugenii]|uniref:coiled-coil domain-containing protein 138 isoform X2 n=1 Tax=Notamacropus eugenii TaxID=9315 RepID=UPI003B67AF62
MEPKIVKPPGQDRALERLKNRYGICSTFPSEVHPPPATGQGDCLSSGLYPRRRPGYRSAAQPAGHRSSPCSPRLPRQFVGLDAQVRCKSRRSLTYTDVLKNSSSDPVMPLPTDSAAAFSQNAKMNSTKSFCDLFKKNVNCLDDDLDYFCDLSPLEVEDDLIEGDHSINIAQTVESFTQETPPDTLLCNSVPGSEYFYDGYCSPLKYTDKSVSSSKMSNKLRQSLLPPHISQIYNELSLIHQKLQQETAGQQEFAAQLHKREYFLSQKEKLLIQHEIALTKIKSVEEEIHTKFQIMKEHHIEEIKHLTEVLKEKTKENKRLKSSFDTLKELNDTLKKQLSDVSEQNKKMEVQAKRVQGRLENLQRKYNFVAVQKCKAVSPSCHGMKTTKQEKTSTSRINKVNGRVYEILIVLMEWISDHHLSKLKPEDGEGDDQKQSCQFSTHRNYIQEKCVKLLPVIAEQLQWMPFVNLKLHLPVIKFIYWSIRQLDYGTQHSTMTATMRRLGEELFKGVTAGTHDASPELFVATKPKTAVFFKSQNLSLRFLSTLIVLQTVTQGFLQPFLEACSNVLFFRTCSVLLRHPKLDLPILEKLSIILQKLSKIKSNKKLFELFTLHLMLHEIQRTANPEHIFLCINLNSILFNLGLTKCNSLVTTTSS